MADNNPTPPPPGVPPKPAESAKVQPKKETVRISLPPKPSAPGGAPLKPSATIKLPSLPGGAPQPATAAPASAGHAPAPAAPAPPPSRPSAVPATVAPPPSSAPRAAVAGAPAPRPAPAAPRPIAAAPAKSISALDTALAIAAAVVGLAAIAFMWLGVLSMQ